MNTDFWFLSSPNQGLLLIDIPFDDPVLRILAGFWAFIFLIRFVVSLIKMIPFV